MSTLEKQQQTSPIEYIIWMKEKSSKQKLSDIDLIKSLFKMSQAIAAYFFTWHFKKNASIWEPFALCAVLDLKVGISLANSDY